MNALDPVAWSILLMLVGCAVLVLEVFIPSGGILSIVSTAALHWGDHVRLPARGQ